MEGASIPVDALAFPVFLILLAIVAALVALASDK